MRVVDGQPSIVWLMDEPEVFTRLPAGDADPSNVSPLVHGAEMRVAETRAVNRDLRKAYGIGICSVEEIGSFSEPAPSSRESKKLRSRSMGRKETTAAPRSATVSAS
jgi:hypothetical protein